MSGYIPHEMIQKQFRWETVNTYLYRRLERDNPFPKLQTIISGMVQLQERQIQSLVKMAGDQGIRIPSMTTKIRYHRSFSEAVHELLDREYQLLNEYESEENYFLSGSSLLPIVKMLTDSQTEQVNSLTQLKKTIRAGVEKKETYPDTESKPDYILESGYRLERVTTGLTYPTAITFDPQGRIYITEAGYAYGAPPGKGRLLRLETNGATTVVADGFGGPVTGISWYQGYFYVAEGAIGETHAKGCGQISKVSEDGRREVIVTSLRTCGDHFTGDIEIGPDGKLYFSVGTAANSAVVGTDNTPWLKLHPDFHDVPARDLVLNGKNFISPNPLSEHKEAIVTGAYKPVGIPSYDGETINGNLMANGVIYCCDPDGRNLKIYADGLRNPFGLKFSPYNGKMYITDNGADPRGSRQIRMDWDNFWDVIPNGWYGFPDFFSGMPVTLPHFHAKDQAMPTFLLKQHPQLATQPQIRFQPHSASHKFDFCTNEAFGYSGDIFVAQLGGSGFEPSERLPGYKVVRVNLQTGQIFDFLVNPKGETNTGGPIRPVAARFSPDGNTLYVVDFGLLGSMEAGTKPKPGSGSLWRIVRAR